MGLYASDRPDVAGMKGLHLFHYVLSNCSQRVRFALEEKGLGWQSHHVDLAANEHVSDDYQRLNPEGVVPTLIHDGQVVIDSNDIIAWLDDHFPEPPLRPGDAEERARMDERITTASGAQDALKTLSHELLFRPFRRMGDAEVALFEQTSRNRELVDFVRDYAEDGDAWRERVARARRDMDRRLAALEQALAGDAWLSGSRFGLADIAWSVNTARLLQAGVALDAFPRLAAWHERVTARPAFQAAIGWRP